MQSTEIQWAYAAHTYRNTPLIKGQWNLDGSDDAFYVMAEPQAVTVKGETKNGRVKVRGSFCHAPTEAICFNALDEASKLLVCEETLIESSSVYYEKNGRHSRSVTVKTRAVLSPARPPALAWDGDRIVRVRPSAVIQNPPSESSGGWGRWFGEITSLNFGVAVDIETATKAAALVARQYAYIRFDEIGLVPKPYGHHDFTCPVHFTDEPPVGKECVDWEPLSTHYKDVGAVPTASIIAAANGETVYYKIHNGGWHLRACKKFGIRY